MVKITTLMAVLFVVSIGLAMAFHPINKTTSTMKFTGGSGFPAVDITTSTMKFTGQE